MPYIPGMTWIKMSLDGSVSGMAWFDYVRGWLEGFTFLE